ncbi:MAG: hypothetical protein AB7V77_04705 [Candidatus Woesearchaeota archaeon]
MNNIITGEEKVAAKIQRDKILNDLLTVSEADVERANQKLMSESSQTQKDSGKEEFYKEIEEVIKKHNLNITSTINNKVEFEKNIDIIVNHYKKINY